MKYVLTFSILMHTICAFSQFDIEGYVYETGNRGYIDGATVTLSNLDQTEFYAQTTSDVSGIYKFSVTQVGPLLLNIEKPPFFDYQEPLEIPSGQSDKMFLKHEIQRKPGYIFDITLAEKDPDPDAYKEALHGALIEVYNNTKKREELVIRDLQTPDFQVNFIKGNHYTILVRKEGFIAKRMEAFVDVKGCILCFEGIGEITPGVMDNLTQSNTMGVLLANVEMDRYFEGKVIGLNDIYYETNKSAITSEARVALDKVARFIKDNPDMSIELGSHTDSRGKSSYNRSLSDKRAKAAVAYLTDYKGVSPDRLVARGYGEDIPTNKCRDGVSCTEEEYAVNRRTELKILKVTSELGFRTLQQMKTEEHMDEILSDLDAAGQIRVPEDGNVEDAIAAREAGAQVEIEKSKADNNEKQRQEEAYRVEEIRKQRQREEVIRAEEIRKQEQKEEEIRAEEIIKQQAKLELEKKDSEAAFAEQRRLESEKMKIAEARVQKEKLEIGNKLKSEQTITEEKREDIPSDSDSPRSGLESWIANQAVPVEEDPSRYSDTYSGYKIVILFSRYALTKEHPMFMRFKDMDVYTTADGNKLYMIESFQTRKEAESRLNKRFKSSFPNSYVVGFSDGIITD